MYTTEQSEKVKLNEYVELAGGNLSKAISEMAEDLRSEKIKLKDK
ncbi:Uncharacterised protein [Mycobacterium tuberculosis]|nr:Uncharacterised protein [Mycobacterium tuberculosis]